MDAAARARSGGVAQVERELAEMWRSVATKDHSVVRACKLNLVVACADADRDLQEATRVLAKVSETEPGRALVVAPAAAGKRESKNDLEVYVSTHCHRGSGGSRVCCEQVTFEVGPHGEPLVGGTVLQLLVEEMPVYTWWRRPLRFADPLLGPLRDVADRLIVDSASFPAPAEGLRTLSSIAGAKSWRGAPADLTWLRLDPWREAVASFFDLPALRPSLGSVTAIEIAAGGPVSLGGRTTAGAYLGGWLASRLGWVPGAKPTVWRLPGGGSVKFEFRHVADLSPGELARVRIDAGDGGSLTSFVVERVAEEDRLVRLSVAGSGSRPLSHVIQLPDADDAAVLCGILQQGTRDPLFDAALAPATRLLEA